VLALTGNDDVNRMIGKVAREKQVKNITALVHDPKNLERFESLKIWTVLLTSLVARVIYRHLTNPRFNVTTLGKGEAELLEMEVDSNYQKSDMQWLDTDNQDWRVVGVLRENSLCYWEKGMPLFAGDRILILGKSDLVKSFSHMMGQEKTDFPLTYGSQMILGLPDDETFDRSDLLREAVYILQHTKARQSRILCQDDACSIQDEMKVWSESLDIQFRKIDSKMDQTLVTESKTTDYGIVVIPPFKPSFFQALRKPVLVDLAHLLSCPLLVARNTVPYEQILIPFSLTQTAQTALRIGIDLSRQVNGKVTAVIVVEPEFLHGGESEKEKWIESVLRKIRKIARTSEVSVEEVIRYGNPVKEILSIADQYHLMVVGSTNREKDLFTPNVGELLVQDAPCSVLVVTQ